MRPCTPTQDAPAPRESAIKPVPHPAAPVGEPSQTRRHHLTPTPVQQLCTHVQSCGQSAFFSYTGRGAFSFWVRPKGAPAAPRAVGRGGARERAQFSPQAETELSGLWRRRQWGAHPPWKRPPCGSRISRGRRAAARPVSVESPPRDFPPDQRGQEVDCPAGETSRSGMPGPAGSGTAPSAAPQKYLLKILPWTGTFSRCPASVQANGADAPPKALERMNENEKTDSAMPVPDPLRRHAGDPRRGRGDR